MFGLIGAHRVGKSTLAQAYATKSKQPYIEANVGAVFVKLGLDPKMTFAMNERLALQSVILNHTIDTVWNKAPGNAICDRTPIDMLAYTLAAVQGDSLTADQEGQLARYADACFTATNRFFDALVLIQPGIPIVDAPGKAAPSAGYIEHLNAIMLGLMLDSRMATKQFSMPRATLDLEDRVKSLEIVWSRTLNRLQERDLPALYVVQGASSKLQ